MNRAMRRAEKHRKGIIKKAPMMVECKPLTLLANCSGYTEEELAHDFIRIRAAFEHVRDGTADNRQFAHLVAVVYMAAHRSLSISPVLVEMMEAAMDALTRAKERYKKHGRYGFDGPGMMAMMDAIEANEEILRNSTPKQMLRAMDAMKNAIKKPCEDGVKLSGLIL